MIVRTVAAEERAGGLSLSAHLHLGEQGGDGCRLFVDCPAAGGAPAAPGDVFLAALLIPAMALGETLRIEGPVSRDLLEAAQTDLVPTLLDWHPRLREVAVEADVVPAASPTSTGGTTASFFSSGVDSWHTLLGREAELDALVHIRGFELELEDERAWRATHANVREIAGARGLDLLPVTTNLRTDGLRLVKEALAARGTPWRKIGTEAWFGSFLVAVGRALHPPLSKLYVPASWTSDVERGVASHPLMEPAWSTPRLRFAIDGFEDDRPAKLDAILAAQPEAVRRLTVCVDKTGRERQGLNCGRCIKCVRLGIELRLAGVADEDLPLPAPVDLARVKVRRIPQGDLAIWERILRRAEQQGDDAARDAILVLLDRKFHLPRFLRDARRRVRTALHGPRTKGSS